MALRRSARLGKATILASSEIQLPRAPKRAAATDASDLTAAMARKPKKTSAPGPTRERELALIAKGFHIIAGVDEAGRGPLAGPVVAAACIIPPDVFVKGVNDSKKISTEKAREAIYEQLVSHPRVSFGVCVVEAPEIDRINILQAALKAMEGAVAQLPTKPDFILVDGNKRPAGFDSETSEAVVRGDGSVYAIACASIIAKVHRDRIMLDLDKRTEGKYAWARNKAYPTADHVRLLHEHGVSEFHRRTFNPVKTMIADQEGAVEGMEEGGKVAKKRK